MRSKLWGYIAAAAFFVEVLLCFSSWVCSVLFPELGIRSVFSGEAHPVAYRWVCRYSGNSFVGLALIVVIGFGHGKRQQGA